MLFENNKAPIHKKKQSCSSIKIINYRSFKLVVVEIVAPISFAWKEGTFQANEIG